MADSSNKLRVALSGSGFLFPAHCGALSALADAGKSIVQYAGTSGGSIISALAATGMDVATMKLLCFTKDWSDMLQFNLLSVLKLEGYCNGDNLLAWLQENTQNKYFYELETDLIIMSSDLTNGKPFVWSKATTPEAKVATACRASASIPMAYSPVIWGGVTHVDGGLANNIPVMRLTQDDIPRLGIDLTSAKGSIPVTSNAIKLLPRVLELMLSASESTQAMFGQYSGARIDYIDTSYAQSLDKNMPLEIRQRLFDDGYKATKALLL